jgi:hypothetical protein
MQLWTSNELKYAGLPAGNSAPSDVLVCSRQADSLVGTHTRHIASAAGLLKMGAPRHGTQMSAGLNQHRLSLFTLRSQGVPAIYLPGFASTHASTGDRRASKSLVLQQPQQQQPSQQQEAAEATGSSICLTSSPQSSAAPEPGGASSDASKALGSAQASPANASAPVSCLAH